MVMKKNIFITVMSNNTPETMTYQKRYSEKNTEESAQRKVDGIMKKTSTVYQKWFAINTRHYLKKEN